MKFKKDESGSTIVLFVPEWELLHKTLGKQNCRNFMYMAGYKLEDEAIIHTYKHSLSREYINLSNDGRAWKYTGDGYEEINSTEAVRDILDMVNSFAR